MRGEFGDNLFSKGKALERDHFKYDWLRVKDIEADFRGSRYGRGQGKPKTVVFDGINACDIIQGSLGDCYLLSAISVIAHTRPELIKKIFHKQSQTYQENGLYVLMFFKNRKPEVIHVDDYFPCENVSCNKKLF